MNGFCLLLRLVFFNLAKTNLFSKCRLAFWPESSVVRENLLNPWPWGPEALPLIISCFLCVCLLRSPALQNPIYFPHLAPLSPSAFTQNCLYWSLKSSAARELEEARL